MHRYHQLSVVRGEIESTSQPSVAWGTDSPHGLLRIVTLVVGDSLGTVWRILQSPFDNTGRRRERMFFCLP